MTRNAGGIGLVGLYSPEDDGAPDEEAKKEVVEFPLGKFWFKGLSNKSGIVEMSPLQGMLKVLIDSGRAKPRLVFEKECRIGDAEEACRELRSIGL